MYITFASENGKIVMGSGTDIGIIALDGVGLADRSRSTAVYADTDGQALLSETTDARTITVKGDIKSREIGAVLTRMARVLYQSGDLFLRFDAKKRRIGAECVLFELSERQGEYQPFTVQFICDYPYFSDFAPTQTNILDVNKKLKSPFVLPCVFSTRYSQSSILNKGDINTEPKLIISALTSGGGDGGIVIENKSTGASITLNYSPARGEVITADIENRSIKSSVAGDIVYSLDNDSYLSDLYLKRGENILSVTNQCGGEINVSCEFSNRYAEAVY